MRTFAGRGYLIVSSSGNICEIYIGTREEAEKECERQSKAIGNLDTFRISGKSMPIYTIS
jgi:hypothetical protein